jgi:acyl-coenzyme A thioesterase PaaI-like protein
MGTMVTSERAIQDQIPNNHCWGCGADNPAGLHLKSFRDGELVVASYLPDTVFAAGPLHVLNGGIIATLLDCHGVCTAIARAYDDDHRPIGSVPEIWHATSSLALDYLRPTPIGEEIALSARVAAVEDRATVVECTLACGGKDRARATVRSVRVPEEWRHGSR